MKLSSLHLLNLLEYGSSKGLDKQALVAQMDSPETVLNEPEGRVSLEEYCRVWEKIRQQSGDTHLGLHFGCSLNLKALGMIYQISLTTSSIGQALGLLEMYLTNSFPVVQLVSGLSQEHLYIELNSTIQDRVMKNEVLDSVLFLMYREISLMIEGEITELQLPYSELQPYQRLCQSRVVSSDVHRLKVDSRLISGEINRRRLKNIDVLLPVFLQLTTRSGHSQGRFSDQVRMMTLSLCSPELPGLDQVVAQFAMSHRTFQRKLSSEGTSFRAIVDEIKRQVSLHLERGNSLQTQEIAYILGYSEPSAYLHALRKWKNLQLYDLTG